MGKDEAVFEENQLRKSGSLFTLIAAFLFLWARLSAQTDVGTPTNKAGLPSLIADRPSFTVTTDLVGTGVVEMDSGVTFDYQGASTFSAPEALIRIGLNKRLELRIGGNGFLLEQAPGYRPVRGYSDVELGLKIQIFGQHGRRPALSLIQSISLPAGSKYFSSNGYDPMLKVALEKDVGQGFSVGGNVNVSSLSTHSGRHVQTAYSAILGHSLGRGFSGYLEIFGSRPWSGDSPTWTGDTGIQWAIGKNAEVDVRIGKGLGKSEPSWFWGAGLAIRLNPRRL